ncbi:hypothetical protein [Streptomyces sp. NPDC052496]|uniref:hypothetical protein n=1 Tax=Streptomyces sp. NPDC052496 TaxID=3154951 RepID=UPI0034399870
MNLDLVRDWAVAAVVLRVFSADIRLLLRRLAAAQVLAGVSELTRTGTSARPRPRTRACTHRTPDRDSPYDLQRDHDLQEGER